MTRLCPIRVDVGYIRIRICIEMKRSVAQDGSYSQFRKFTDRFSEPMRDPSPIESAFPHGIYDCRDS